MRKSVVSILMEVRKFYIYGVIVLFIMPPLGIVSALGNTASPTYAITDTSTFWTILGALSVFANRVAEGIKRGLKLKFPTMSEDWIAFIALVSSFVGALIGALLLSLNVFDILPVNPYTSKLPDLIGIIIIAGVAAFGSEGLHWLLDVLAAGAKRIEAPAAGGFKQKTETTFTPPKPEPDVSSTMTTPAGTATSTPTPASGTILSNDPDLHG